VTTAINIYENDPDFVLKAFCEGNVDYIEATSELAEMDFFKFLVGNKTLRKISLKYPTPRLKQEIPAFFHIASNMSMRLHGSHTFRHLNYIWRTGGMLEALGHEAVSKKVDPDTGNVIVACKGFNRKNSYPRKTPCNQDSVRKFSHDTDAEKLQAWYNYDIVKAFQGLGVFDSGGICIGDGTYIFVPDNPEYEGSKVMVFNENNSPVNPDKLSREELLRCRRRRCYKLVTLLYVTGNRDLFICVGARIVSGEKKEGPLLWDMVEEFNIRFPGVMKKLILDRGFINGEKMGESKQRFGVDTIIPVRKNMDIYKDIMGLAKLGEWRDYESPERKVVPAEKGEEKPEVIRMREQTRQKTLKKKKKEMEKREEPVDPAKVLVKKQVTGIDELSTWDECPILLKAAVMREEYADGHERMWTLVTTEDFSDPADLFDSYAVRTDIEERHRQYKCYWDLTGFKSRSFSHVTNQIIFVLLTYSMLQVHIRLRALGEINRQTIETLRRKLRESQPKVVIYYQDKVAFITIQRYTKLLLKLEEKARKKILKKANQMWDMLDDEDEYFDSG